MAIGFRSASSGDIASPTATTTISLQSGVQATDIVIVIFCTAQTTSPSTMTPPSGWTAIVGALNGNDGINQYVTINGFWALGNVTNLGFTNSFSSGAKQGWECAAFTGVDNTTPIDATGLTSFNHGSATLTANAVTVATANAWEVIGFGDFFKNRFTATGFTPLENGTPATNQTACILYNSTPLGTGSTGTVSVSSNPFTGSQQILVAMPFALRPASAAVAHRMTQASFF